MTTLFISDLHLHSSRPAATDCFLRFLSGRARDASALYVLGDLFEAWIGDDAAGPHEREILDALRQHTAAGNECGFLRGNRDFLVGPRFAGLTGMSLLADETTLEVAGERTLLMHGDTLCTDDAGYQRYRRFVHRPLVQAAYLGLPAGLRSRIAGFARRRSVEAIAEKATEIMDVNQRAVNDALDRNRARLLIHGHTHRPAVHEFMHDDAPARRIVLGAWYEQGSVLSWDRNGPQLETISFN